MPPKADPKKGGKAGEVEPAIDVAKTMKDLRPRWEKFAATVGAPLESKVGVWSHCCLFYSVATQHLRR
jgi:hypothetical protein